MIYILLGLISTVLGVIGIWLPGLPTTIFILIALWAFSHSSQRLYNWLVRVPLLKTAVIEAHRFQNEGTVDIRAKIVSQTCSWISFVVVTLVFQSLAISLIVGLLALSCTVFMVMIPTRQAAVVSNDD